MVFLFDGNTKGWFAEDTAARFQAYGWHVQKVDGHDSEAITKAIKEAQKVIDKPSIICCKTIIGFGSPNKQGTQNCHGSPLGDAEIQLAKESGMQVISLGKRILRTETAGLTTLSIIMFELEQD